MLLQCLEEGSLTSGQARPLIGITNASAIAEEIVANNYSARKVEYLTRQKKNKRIANTKLIKIFLMSKQELRKKLGLKVKYYNKKDNSGKISIEYKDLDQFEMISKLLTKN